MRRWVLAALMLLGPARTWAGDTLKVGDPAPPLKVGKWIKGEPVATFEPSQTYVIDFWSTTVAESRAGVAHLSDLARQHPEARFVGVAVLEKDPKLVAPFVNKQGDRMGYSVVLDRTTGGRSATGAMVTTWLKAAGLTGIPSTFVVRDSKVAWVGRPAELDGPLAAILAGTYQPEPKPAAAGDAASDSAVEERVEAAVDAHDYPTVFRLIDEAVARNPSLADELGSHKFIALCNTGRPDEGLKLGEKLVEAEKFDGGELNYLAWGVVDPSLPNPIDPRVAQLAHRAATRAVELDAGDPDFLDTLAAADYRTGNFAGALANAQKALKNIHRADPEEARELADSLRTNIKRYRDAAQTAAGTARPAATRSTPKKP